MDSSVFFQHGGNREAAADYYQIPVTELLDFSANINSFISPEIIKNIILDNWEQIYHYPDPDYQILYQSLSQYFQIDKDVLCCGNGSVELIYQLVDFLKPQRALIIQPNFSEYEKALLMHNSSIEYIIGSSQDNFKVAAIDIIKAAREKRINVIFLSNPNNPAGYLYQPEELIEILKTLKETYLVVDEAFIDFTVKKYSIIAEIARYPQLIVLRSLTKILAIPGLRLGFLVGAKKITAAFKTCQIPWHINSLAKVIGENICLLQSEIKGTPELVLTNRGSMQKALQQIPELTVYKSESNFFLFQLSGAFVPRDFQKYLAQNKILVRNCFNFRGLDSSWFRTAVKKTAENKLFFNACKHFFQT